MARYMKISAGTLENEGRRLICGFPTSFERLTAKFEPGEYLAIRLPTDDGLSFISIENTYDALLLFEGCELYKFTPPKKGTKSRL
jgi:hypothetical protein